MSVPIQSPTSFHTDAEHHFRMERRARSDGQPPLQQSVSSASPIPRSPARSSYSSHIASYQYVQQHRIFVERQRESHDEERKLWHLERQELHTKIFDLEATIRQLQQKSTKQPNLPNDFHKPAQTASGDYTSNKGSDSISESTGDEFWRGAGGKSDSIPTRTFSDASDYSSTKADDRHLPSISEDEVAAPVVSSSAGISRVVSNENKPRYRRSSVDEAQLHKNLDGISFKPSTSAPFVFKKTTSPQSSSPSRSPTSGPASPPKPHDLPPSNNLIVEDPYTKNAGHTPLARGGSVYSDHSSANLTPRLPETNGQFEPRPSVAVSRPPNERSDSYFPPPPESIDEDPELKGPLTLPNEASEDKSFLTELDSRLLHAARSHAFSPAEASGPSRGRDEEGDKSFDQPEPEPKLRIKRSMNFGSAFGSLHNGRLAA